MKASLDGVIHLHNVTMPELNMVLTYLTDIFDRKTPLTIRVWGTCIDDCPGLHEPVQRELMGHTVAGSGSDDLVIECDPPPYHRVVPGDTEEWKHVTINVGN